MSTTHRWQSSSSSSSSYSWLNDGPSNNNNNNNNNKKKQGNHIDDDLTRDDVCRDYLMNFLNGTTDAKDECQAMSRAWDVADCKDYSSGNDENIVRSFKKNNDGNSTKTNDDVLIDDAFEKWECCSSITDFYGKHCREQQLDAFRLLSIVLVLIVCGLFKAAIRMSGWQWIPSAGACIIVGAVVGGLMRLLAGAKTAGSVQDRLLSFNNDLFLQIMLPPIVFEAAISIDKRAFRRDLFPILTFAIVGTFFSAVAIGYITYGLTGMGKSGGLPFLDSLLFGALMSSIDPVATLSILSSVGVSHHDTLYTLIFGESLLNDGVSIVLFDSLVRHMGDDAVVDHATVQSTLLDFLWVSTASIFIGVACGALATFYFWALRRKQSAVTEVALFFAWALVPYYIADGLKLSGIISIMVMGFMMDYFVIGGHQTDEGEWMDYMETRRPCTGESNNNLVRAVSATSANSVLPPHPGPVQFGTPHNHPVEPCFDRFILACCKAFSGRGHIATRSRHHVGFCAEVVANIMETAIFAYLGLFLFNDRVWSLSMTSAGLLACVSSRAVMVVALSLIINLCVWLDLEMIIIRLCRMCCFPSTNSAAAETVPDRDDDDSVFSFTRVYLDGKTQVILFSAGVRGAVSYALVQNIPVYDSVTKTGSHYKGELRSMTSATIMIILFAFGALTYFTVQRDSSQTDRERVAGSLTHRLLSISLHSDEGRRGVDEGAEVDSDPGNSSFEIESPSPSRPHSR